MTGAMLTPTRMPAPASRSMTWSRRAGSGDARLDGAGEVLVVEGKADRDAEAGIAGELLEDVDVALDDR